MDPTRRSVRHLDSRDDSNRLQTNDPFGISPDSGRGSTGRTERGSTGENLTTSGASSSLSRDTPLNDDPDKEARKSHNNESVRIGRTPILGNRCYEQAYVSHVNHPSAFFLQLAHPQNKYEKLHREIHNYYSTNSQPNPSKWKRGDYCVAKFTDNRFYRGRIIEVPEITKTPDSYDVVFLDFGNWDKVAANDIHLLQPEFAELPAQAIPCSLNKSLPKNGTWSDHPEAMQLFEQLVSEKFVDATFHLKSSRDSWPLSFVDLQLCSTKLDVRERMKDHIDPDLISNEKIYIEFNRLLGPADYIIYSIPTEDDDYNDDDD